MFRYVKLFVLTRIVDIDCMKAIAWCPWQASLLASGGGSIDRQIRLWNVSSGTCLQTMETNSQVGVVCHVMIMNIANGSLVLYNEIVIHI